MLFRHNLLPRFLLLLILLSLVACDDAPPVNAPPSEPASTEGREGYAIPFPMMEYWEGTTVLKYKYEMRFGSSGKVARNGWSSAYFASGSIEREGAYLDGQRAGQWTYYTPDGAVDRVEDRGANPPWTAPGQLIPSPGTDP